MEPIQVYIGTKVLGKFADWLKGKSKNKAVKKTAGAVSWLAGLFAGSRRAK